MGLTVEEKLFGLNRQIPGQKKWVSLNSHETLMLNNVNIILDCFLKFPKVPMVVFLDLHVQAVKLPYQSISDLSILGRAAHTYSYSSWRCL